MRFLLLKLCFSCLKPVVSVIFSFWTDFATAQKCDWNQSKNNQMPQCCVHCGTLVDFISDLILDIISLYLNNADFDTLRRADESPVINYSYFVPISLNSDRMMILSCSFLQITEVTGVLYTLCQARSCFEVQSCAELTPLSDFVSW